MQRSRPVATTPSTVQTDADRRLSIVQLGDGRASSHTSVGAKAAALARLARAGLPVLDGFVVTTAVTDTLGSAVFEAARPSWAALSDQGRRELVVRSSSTAEDAVDSSMAGRFTSVLHVAGWEAFEQAVAEVVASATEVGDEPAPIAVLVQPQAEARFGGVLFGADPLTGAADRLLLSVTDGPPDDIVSGRATGTSVVLSRRGRILEVDGSLDPLPDRRIRRALASLARQACAIFGGPQDIEWLVEPDGTVRLLQSRPITTVAPATGSHVYGSGPVIETFPDPLSPLEQDLWLPPLDAGITAALRTIGAVTRRSLAAADDHAEESGTSRHGRFVIDVGGRVAVDLQALGIVPRAHDRWAAIDPRRSLPRLRAAWRTGRLRGAFDAIAEDLVREVDGHLAALPDLRDLDDRELTTICASAGDALIGLHAHEILSGFFVDPDASGPTGASVASDTLARARRDGLDDAAIIARHPTVLALVAPRIGAPPPLGEGRVNSSQLSGDADPLVVAREALRLRIRWVQQLTVDTALELGKRLVRHGTLDDPSDVRWFRFEELVAHLDDPTAADVAPAPPPEVPALPERFRLSDSGEVVADWSGSDGGPTGVSPGRASGTVAHEPGTPDRPVLVVGSLDPTLATELPNVAAIVSETGSPLSHLAILAREQHVPVVVGVPDATSAHPVGQHVIVDGDAGTIEPDEQVPAEEGERSRS